MHYKGTIFISEVIKSHMKTQPKQRQRNDKMILPTRGHASVLVSFMLVSEEETCKRWSFAPLDDESPRICRTSSHQTVEIGSGPWPWCRLTPRSVHVRLQSVTWQPWHSPADVSSILRKNHDLKEPNWTFIAFQGFVKNVRMPCRSSWLFV